MSGELEKLKKMLNSRWPGFLERLTEDETVSLVLVIGSWARCAARSSSDIDLLVITRRDDLGIYRGIHCFEKETPSIDILFIQENDVHSERLSYYDRQSLLIHREILVNNCEKCCGIITNDRFDQKNKDLSELERHSLVWHLMHIRNKFIAASNDITAQIYKAKFIYYFPLVFVRVIGLDLVGEDSAIDIIKSRYSKIFNKLSNICLNSLNTQTVVNVIDELIQETEKICGLTNVDFLVEKHNLVMPIRLENDPDPSIKSALDWCRNLFK